MTRRVQIVANPTAGGFRYWKLQRLADRLDERGIKVDVRLTKHAGDLTDIARYLDPEVDTLVVGGGDGSINEAVTGLLARSELRPALAVLPFGTANVLAHELALPFHPNKIAAAIDANKKKPLHPGLIGKRPFILMVSAGFDADVVHAVDSATKKRWGKLAYAAAGLRLALAQKGRDVTVTADGETITCRLAVVTTAKFYGGPLTITRHTDVTRPGLRLVTLADDSKWTLAKAATLLGLGLLHKLGAATDREVREVRFSGPGIQLQIDGDKLATTDDLIQSSEQVLDIIVS